ncbi:MAG: alanine racemase [Flavobacteriaceae bacterium]
MVGETILEINLFALKNNFDILRAKINKNTMLLAVVKAFAYGSDAVKIAQFLEEQGINYFAVAYINEGVLLRKSGIKTPILVLHPQPINFQLLIKFNLEPSLYSFNTLNAFIEVANTNSKENFPVHIKFNTGLNRLGFAQKQIEGVVKIVNSNPSIHVKSVFSHLAASEDEKERDFSLNQIELFHNITEAFQSLCGYSFIRHLCNTSGVVNFPEAQFDMVRCGIGIYGFDNMKNNNHKFIPVAALKTIISQIHTIEKGQSVGYNRAFIAEHDKKIATLPIGHADGIGRQYGNGVGSVYVQGQKAPIVGNVCMDMIMIDVSEIDCNEGDEVILFDKNTTAEEFAINGDTISYELLTGISQRVKRVFITG